MIFFFLFSFSDVSQSNADLLSGLGGVFSSVQPTPLADNNAHSAMLFTTNHNLSPLEATFASPGEFVSHSIIINRRETADNVAIHMFTPNGSV